MPSPYDTTCLYSTVQNISGSAKTFGFLPPHGRTLDDQEEMTVIGPITEAITRGRQASERMLQSFVNAVEDGYLLIKSTNVPILYDEALDVVKMLRLNNGSLGTHDACWETSI